MSGTTLQINLQNSQATQMFPVWTTAVERIIGCSSPTETTDLLALYTCYSKRAHNCQSTKSAILAKELGWTEWKILYCSKLLKKLQLLEEKI